MIRRSETSDLFLCVHKLAVVLRTGYSMFGFWFDCFFSLKVSFDTFQACNIRTEYAVWCENCSTILLSENSQKLSSGGNSPMYCIFSPPAQLQISRLCTLRAKFITCVCSISVSHFLFYCSMQQPGVVVSRTPCISSPHEAAAPRCSGGMKHHPRIVITL